MKIKYYNNMVTKLIDIIQIDNLEWNNNIIIIVRF